MTRFHKHEKHFRPSKKERRTCDALGNQAACTKPSFGFAEGKYIIFMSKCLDVTAESYNNVFSFSIFVIAGCGTLDIGCTVYLRVCCLFNERDAKCVGNVVVRSQGDSRTMSEKESVACLCITCAILFSRAKSASSAGHNAINTRVF